MLGRVVLMLVLAATPLHAQPSLTIIAPAAPGGGWDQTARVMQRVLAEIEPATTVQVDNIPGAAGTIGLSRFVQSERGNPHALLVTGLVMVSGAIINASPVSLANATPIARLTALYGGRFRLGGLSLEEAGIVLLVGAVLGLLGAWIGAARHLSRIEPRP